MMRLASPETASSLLTLLLFGWRGIRVCLFFPRILNVPGISQELVILIRTYSSTMFKSYLV